MAAQEPGIVEFTNVDTLGYISKPYRKAAHLINLHSWAPVSLDMESFGFYPGFSVVSQNKLGTAEAMMGYKWKTQERTGQAYLNFEYRGWYPIFRLEGIPAGVRRNTTWLRNTRTKGDRSPDGTRY